jgi:putative ABC transport system permease protein
MTLFPEIRGALRAARSHLGESTAAVLLAAAGIGILTVSLALADAALWRPLAWDRSGAVVVLYASHTSPREQRARVAWSFQRLQFARERATTVDRITDWRPASVTLTGSDAPQVVDGEIVSRHYFALLGVSAAEGRTFAPDEDVAGAPKPVVVVSEAFGARRRAKAGTELRLNGQVVTVIGVMPRAFHGLTGKADIWLPTPLAPVLTYPGYLTTNQDFIQLLARRLPERSLAEVNAEVASLAAAAHRAIPSDAGAANLTIGGAAVPLAEARIRPEGRQAARLLLAGGVLLAALTVTNLIALLLVRALARQRANAVALALGASRLRLWVGHAAEGAVFVAGGALLAAAGLAALFAAAGPIDIVSSSGRGFFSTFSAVSGEFRVWGWWIAAAIAIAAPSILLPGVLSARGADFDHLRAGSRGSSAAGLSLRRPGPAAAILAAEATMAVLLVATAGQFVESYRRMIRVDLGVDVERVLTFELQPSEQSVPPERAAAFVTRVLDAVRAVPGVVSASVDGGAPLAGSASSGLHVVGRADEPSGPPTVLRHYVGAEHFATLGIPLLRGRTFTDADRPNAPAVVVISESAARRYFPAADPIGQRVWFTGSTLTSPDNSGEIVGIVGDVKYQSLLGERTTASFYTPYQQFTYGWRVYFVKVAGEPRAVERAVAAAVGSVAPDLPLLNFRPLEDIVELSRDPSRRAAQGTGLVALVGLLLAACGVWAVVSHVTARRARDMAIRVAHGASAGAIARLVVTGGIGWPLAGIAGGAVLAMAGSGFLASQLYSIAPGDPWIVLGGAAVCILAAASACLAPALRATRVDPIALLRAD